MSKAKQLSDVMVYDPASFDNEPVEMPVHLKVQVSERAEMLRLIREELSRAAEGAGHESFAEAEDFDLNDDLPYSPYELTPLQEEYIMHPERFARVGEKKDVKGSDSAGIKDSAVRGGAVSVGSGAAAEAGVSGGHEKGSEGNAAAVGSDSK